MTQYRPESAEEDRQSSASWMEEINAAYNQPVDEHPPKMSIDTGIPAMDRMSLTTFDRQMQQKPTVKTNLGKASVSFDLPAMESNSQAKHRSKADAFPQRQPLPMQPAHMRDPYANEGKRQQQVPKKKKKTNWIKKLFSTSTPERRPSQKQQRPQPQPQYYNEPDHRQYTEPQGEPVARYEEENHAENRRQLFETESKSKNATIVAPYPVRASLFRPESFSQIEKQREEEGGSHLIEEPSAGEETDKEEDLPASAADLHLQKMSQQKKDVPEQAEEAEKVLPLPERSTTPQNNSTLPSTAQSSRPNSRGSVQNMHEIFEELKEDPAMQGQQSPDVIGQDLDSTLDRQSFLFVDDTLMKFIQRKSALLEPPSTIQQWTEGPGIKHTKLPKIQGPSVPPRKTDSIMELGSTPLETPEKASSPVPPAKEARASSRERSQPKPKNPLRISTLKEIAANPQPKRESQVSSASTATLLKSALKKRNSVKAERRVTFKDSFADQTPRRTAPRVKSAIAPSTREVLPSPPPRAGSQMDAVPEEVMMQMMTIQQQVENERKAKESLRATLRASQVNFDDFAEKAGMHVKKLTLEKQALESQLLAMKKELKTMRLSMMSQR